MANKKQTIDGIVPRGNRQVIGSYLKPRKLGRSKGPKLDSLRNDKAKSLSSRERQEIDDDFEIDYEDLETNEKEAVENKKRWFRRAKKDKPKKKKSFLRKLFKRVFLLTSLTTAVFIGFIGLKAFLAANNVIDRNGNCPVILCDEASAASLQGEGDGRVNIMMIGIGGEGHDGGELADTIIIASIDPIAKEAAMLSVPRDLYLNIPEFGSTRVNAAHAYGEQYGFEKEGYPDGGVGLQQLTLEEALDIKIHYYLRVDFAAFTQAVDSVGGVDVNLESALYDPTFWWQFGVLDLAAGPHKLDGTTALMYVRSRKTSARGDFDRSERQREVILSLKNKIVSLDTFSDPRKIVGLIDTFGSNVRTNIQLSEMVRLYEISEEISDDKIVSSGLGDEGVNFLSSATIDGASVLIPSAGDFSEIQKYVRSIFTDGFIKNENAQIGVLNGTTTAGLATSITTELESYGYHVASIEVAPTADFVETVVYDVSDGSKAFTKSLLEKRFGVEMVSASFVPDGVVTEGLDFIVIIGADRVQ